MMRRRELLALLPGVVLAATELSDAGNDFKTAYNDWVRMLNEQEPGTTSAPALRQWPIVKAAWHALEQNVERDLKKA